MEQRDRIQTAELMAWAMGLGRTGGEVARRGAGLPNEANFGKNRVFGVYGWDGVLRAWPPPGVGGRLRQTKPILPLAGKHEMRISKCETKQIGPWGSSTHEYHNVKQSQSGIGRICDKSLSKRELQRKCIVPGRGKTKPIGPGSGGIREIRNPKLYIRNKFEMPRTETSRSAPNEPNFGVLGSKTRIGVENKANPAVGRGRRRRCLCSEVRGRLGAAGFGAPAFPGARGLWLGRARGVARRLSF